MPTQPTVKLFLYFVLLCILVGGVYGIWVNKDSTPISTPNTTSIQTSSSSSNQFTIIAFGDSLTAGYGVSLEESYPALLEQNLLSQKKNVNVINMGVSGETTTGSLDRVDFVISQKPSLVLLGIGANDMLRSSSPTITKENIRSIINRLQQENIDIILLGMKSVASNGSNYTKEFDAIYSTLAKEYTMPLVPFFLEGVVLNPALNINDGIHPNKAGYEKIIKENILPVLLPVLTREGV